MLNKVLSLVLVFCLIAPPVALAEELIVPPAGKITGLRYKQPAPYTGVLLNSVAAARLLANGDYSEKQWELKLDYELAKLAARLNLIIETQKISYEALQEKHITLINIKNSEIERLSAIAAKQDDYSKWWATGGFIAGVVLTVTLVYAIKDIK